MMSTKRGKKGDILLEMKDIRIDGFSDERWHKIIKGIDLTLHRGEVMGLIGESGAGKSTLGLASMGFTKPGCKITSGSFKRPATVLLISDLKSCQTNLTRSGLS